MVISPVHVLTIFGASRCTQECSHQEDRIRVTCRGRERVVETTMQRENAITISKVGNANAVQAERKPWSPLGCAFMFSSAYSPMSLNRTSSTASASRCSRPANAKFGAKSNARIRI